MPRFLDWRTGTRLCAVRSGPRVLESARGPFRGGAPRRNPERPGLLALPTGGRLSRQRPQCAARVLESARGPFRGRASGRAAGRPRLLALSPSLKLPGVGHRAIGAVPTKRTTYRTGGLRSTLKLPSVALAATRAR